MYSFSSIHKEHIIFSNSLTDRSVFLHQIECCKIQFTSIKLNLVLSKQKLIVDKYSRYRQAESIRLKFVSVYHISLILCIQDHPNYQNIQNMACPPYRCQTKEFSGDQHTFRSMRMNDLFLYQNSAYQMKHIN